MRRRRFYSYHPLVKALLIFLLLPYVLSVPYQLIHPPSTLMLYDLAKLRLPDRDWVGLDAISPNLVKAVITSEDSAFCEHWGFDFDQLKKSWHKAQKNDAPVKATSTITQQLAKNLFLWHGRSWLRKGLEIPLTFWLEMTWSKRQIIETYLNVVEWDDGVYGAEAAARHYFGKSARSVNIAQAALLATTLPNPAERNAAHPGPAQAIMSAQLVGRALRSTPDLTCIR